MKNAEHSRSIQWSNKKPFDVLETPSVVAPSSGLGVLWSTSASSGPDPHGTRMNGFGRAPKAEEQNEQRNPAVLE